MIEKKTLVNDSLLKELSSETRKIGSRVLVKETKNHPEYIADIIDVIILPHFPFYREKFMACYETCNYNSVKALKELHRLFPFIPDFQLGVAYVLNIETCVENLIGIDPIKIKGEFEFSDNALNTSEIQTYKLL